MDFMLCVCVCVAGLQSLGLAKFGHCLPKGSLCLSLSEQAARLFGFLLRVNHSLFVISLSHLRISSRNLLLSFSRLRDSLIDKVLIRMSR